MFRTYLVGVDGTSERGHDGSYFIHKAGAERLIWKTNPSLARTLLMAFRPSSRISDSSEHIHLN